MFPLIPALAAAASLAQLAPSHVGSLDSHKTSKHQRTMAERQQQF